MTVPELKYRTFQQLLDSIKLDFRKYDTENLIDDFSLIKIAQKINEQLGLKIHPRKGKVLEVVDGKAKLPSDLKVLNFALLCGKPEIYDLISTPYNLKTYRQGLIDGYMITQLSNIEKNVNQFTLYTDIAQGNNVIQHDLCTRHVVVQATTPNGNLLLFDLQIIDDNRINIISDVEQTLENVKVIILGAKRSFGVLCRPEGCDPCNYLTMQEELQRLNLLSNDPARLVQNMVDPCEPPQVLAVEPSCEPVYEECVESQSCSLSHIDKNKYKKYRNLGLLRIQDAKSTTFDEVKLESSAIDVITVRNGFIETNFPSGTIYINYRGLMENEEGELLVLDHPLVNDYYEYALKSFILEQLLIAGEKVGDLYKLVVEKERLAKIQAVNYVRTPGFKEILNANRIVRKAMYLKYYKMFEK